MEGKESIASIEDSHFDQMFQFKYGSKQFQKEAKTCEKDQQKERRRIKEALEQGNVEGARIYSENSIRKKNEALHYLRMSSRVDAVHPRVIDAIKNKEVTKSLASAYKELSEALKEMDEEKVSRLLDELEKKLGMAQVPTDVLNNTLDTQFNQQVDALILQVAKENGLELIGQLSELQS